VSSNIIEEILKLNINNLLQARNIYKSLTIVIVFIEEKIIKMHFIIIIILNRSIFKIIHFLH